jgi:hypothetical protein|tara:strand:- start:450 stop:584 length:135 start_codon:yes stop_codon:yes gene_type:complete
MTEPTNKDKIIDEIVLLKLRHPLSVEDKLKLQKLQQQLNNGTND